MTPRRPSILAVFDLPPVAGSPHGSAGRLRSFLLSLAERFDLGVVVMRNSDEQYPMQLEESLRGIPVSRSADLDVGANPVLIPGWRGRPRRLLHYSLARYPTSCHPRTSAALADRIREWKPDALMLYRANHAALLQQIPESVPVIAAVEEVFEPAEVGGLRASGFDPARSAWIARSEMTRHRRLFELVKARAALATFISDDELAKVAPILESTPTAVVPHGIDLEYFVPVEADRDIDVLVVGMMGQERNRASALRIWHAAQREPDARSWRWAFVGAGSDDLDLGGDTIGTGRVDDVRPFYARAKVVLVPADAGNGVKTTLLQAWAMRRAAVATTFSLRGTRAIDGREVLSADSPSEMVAKLRRALADPALREQLVDGGTRLVESDHDERASARLFGDLCLDAQRAFSTRGDGNLSG